MSLSREDYWERIGKHLDLIGSGAEMCRRHVNALPARPPYETWAENDLVLCEAALDRALTHVRAALKIYRLKETVK